jgi:hypothetical protein
MDKDERRQIKAAILIVYVGVAIIVAIEFAFALSTPAYKFKTEVSPPQEIRDLLKNGPVVLLFTHNDSPGPWNVTQAIADLQSQHNGTNVTIVHFNVDNNTTSRNVGKVYGVTATPTTIVLRKDGAAATFVGVFDANVVKSAIQDAQNWQQTHSTPTPLPTPIPTPLPTPVQCHLAFVSVFGLCFRTNG